MNPLDLTRAHTRRHFLANAGKLSVGSLALAQLLGPRAFAATAGGVANPLAPRAPNLPAKAKSVIYLSMSGAPPQMDLFTDKPKLREYHMQPAPESLTKGEIFAFIKGTP